MTLETVVLALPTADRVRAHAFYGPDGLGLPTRGEPAEDGVPEPLRLVVNDGLQLMLVPTDGFGWGTAGRAVAEPGTVECQVVVAEADPAGVDAFARRWRDAGGEVAAGPADLGWTYSATLADPDGHLWTVMTTPGD